jgi:hypothetical protein
MPNLKAWPPASQGLWPRDGSGCGADRIEGRQVEIGCETTTAAKYWELFPGFCGEEFAAGGDEGLLFGGGEREGGEDFLRKFGEGDVVGCPEFALPLRGGEDIPTAGGDPVDAGHVWRGDEAFDFEELRVTGGAGSVGDDELWVVGLRVFRFVKVDEGEHFSADGLVSGPEDEVSAPLHGFDHVREGEEIGSKAFGVHEGKVLLRQVLGRAVYCTDFAERLADGSWGILTSLAVSKPWAAAWDWMPDRTSGASAGERERIQSDLWLGFPTRAQL